MLRAHQHGVSDVIVQAYGDINADQNVVPPMNGFIKNHREDHGAPNQGADVMRYVGPATPPHAARTCSMPAYAPPSLFFLTREQVL